MADCARFCLRSALFVPAIAVGNRRDDRVDCRERSDSIACGDIRARDESLARGNSVSRGNSRGCADFRASDDAHACGERFEWVVGESPVQHRFGCYG